MEAAPAAGRARQRRVAGFIDDDTHGLEGFVVVVGSLPEAAGPQQLDDFGLVRSQSDQDLERHHLRPSHHLQPADLIDPQPDAGRARQREHSRRAAHGSNSSAGRSSLSGGLFPLFSLFSLFPVCPPV
jgi:hypothetical protein